jgi:hypothetical protein
VGLHLSWFMYRGPGKVTFTPEQIKVWEDTRTGANSPWAPLAAAWRGRRRDGCRGALTQPGPELRT